MIRIETGGAKRPAFHRADGDLLKAMCVQVSPQGRKDVVFVGSDHIAQLTMGGCMTDNGVDGCFRHAAFHRQDGEGVPAKGALGRVEVFFTPIFADGRHAAAARQPPAAPCGYRVSSCLAAIPAP